MVKMQSFFLTPLLVVSMWAFSPAAHAKPLTITSMSCPIDLQTHVKSEEPSFTRVRHSKKIDLSLNITGGYTKIYFLDNTQTAWLKEIQSEEGKTIYLVNGFDKTGVALVSSSSSRLPQVSVLSDHSFGDDTLVPIVFSDQNVYIAKKSNGAIVSAFYFNQQFDSLFLVTRETEINGVSIDSKIAVVVTRNEIVTIQLDLKEPKIISTLPLPERSFEEKIIQVKKSSYSNFMARKIERSEYQVEMTFPDHPTKHFGFADDGKLIEL